MSAPGWMVDGALAWYTRPAGTWACVVSGIPFLLGSLDVVSITIEDPDYRSGKPTFVRVAPCSTLTERTP